MNHPKPLRGRDFRPRLSVGGALVLSALAGALLGSAPAAQAGRAARPDQVLFVKRSNSRGTASVTALAGVVTENTLEQVVLTSGDKERELESDTVQRITFGDVPPAYGEAQSYMERSDYESATAKYRLAAGDAAARDVVRASARLLAGQAAYRQGTRDPNAFPIAVQEAAVFLTDFPDNRQVPQGRELQARATRMSGDAGQAAELYKSLFKEASGGKATTGYDLLLCYRAGLAAAQCYLEENDTERAREIYSQMETALPPLLAGLDEGDRERTELVSIQAQARLGEGFSLLASGSNSQAATFFGAQFQSAGDRGEAHRFGARLGLGMAYMAEGKLREAQAEFATVSAIDHTDRDRAARALLGLAECTLQLAGSDSRQEARTWLQTIVDQYGDTPSVLVARQMLETL